MVKLNQKNREEYTRIVIEALQKGNIKRFREYFLELHPTDQVDLFVSLKNDQRKRVYEFLSPMEFAAIFQGLELDEQKIYITELEHSFAVDMFNHMPADDVADFLGELSTPNADHFLNKMGVEYARDVKSLLSYPEESAGSIMTTEFISISIEQTVEEVMDLLREEAPDAETIYYLYVADHNEKLVGVLSLRDLIVASSTERIENIMSTRVVSVPVTEDQEHVAHVIQKYDFLAVPVVNRQGKFVGIVTVDDVMDIVEEEVTEDIGEITASRGATDVNITSFQSARKRSPWIVILMFLGLITAGVIGQFEETLEQVAILAAFIPMIMGSAGNTGTQSLAVIVRSLALGMVEKAGIGNMLKRELGTGIMIGVVCAVIISILLPLVYGSYMLGVIVGFSLLFSLTLSAVIGAIVPLIINRFHIDPAVASGPFITTLIDLVSLLIYFSVATSLLAYL